jgi:hypothetical protein
MTNKFLEETFKELIYIFGEINWNIIKNESWDKYINKDEPFNEKQFDELRHIAYDIADDYAIEFAEWLKDKPRNQFNRESLEQFKIEKGYGNNI